MLPRLSDQGDVQYLKIGKRNNGKDYSEERKLLVTFYEYYLEDITEIEAFIKMFAVNAEMFNTKLYIDMVIDTKPVPAESSIITMD